MRVDGLLEKEKKKELRPQRSGFIWRGVRGGKRVVTKMMRMS